MRIGTAVILALLLTAAAWGEAPDISKVPPHPRLWIGGVKTAHGYIDPNKLAERAKTHAEDFALLKQTKQIDARALYAMVAVDKAMFAKVVEDLKSFTCNDGHTLYPYTLAYDWVAQDLPEADRKAIAKHLADVALGPVAGHFKGTDVFDNNSLRRAMGLGLAGLAVAGDDPRAEQMFKESHKLMTQWLEITGDGAKANDMEGRGAYGGGWPEGQDYDRHGSRYAMIYFLGLRSATGMDVFTKSQFWKDKIFYQIYSVLPNGRNVLPFQDHDNCEVHRFDREEILVLAREFDEPHARYYLNHVNTEKVSSSATFDFLYGEPKAKEHDYSDLPKAHYVPGTGMVYARSGWGPNDTYLGFCASDWYVYHQNNAQNVFAIYRNAPLAVKDGVYNGDMHPQYVNYSIRTISYCGITVFDPKESFHGPDEIPVAANDGGQMIQNWTGDAQNLAQWREQAHRTGRPMRDIVDWKGFETNDKYTYMAAEAGRAYAPGKVPFFSRQIVFVFPNWIVVFDRVTSSEASFTKQFHMHAPDEMTVKGNEAIVTTKTTLRAMKKEGKAKADDTPVKELVTTPGRLFVTSLLPKSAKLEKVEGVAVYGGKSYRGPDPYNGQMYCPVHLQITAPEEKDTCFLTAMYACDATVKDAPEAKVLSESKDRVTVGIEGKWKIEFSKTGEVGWKMVK